MPKYFCTHTRLSCLEREMMKVPYRNYPRPRSPSNFRYICSICQHREADSNGLCVAENNGEKCPYLLERLQSGTANRLVSLQQARFDNVVLPRSIFFDISQKRRFRLLCGSIDHNRKNPKEVAVLYLLSAEESLFDRCIGNTPEELLRNLDMTPPTKSRNRLLVGTLSKGLRQRVCVCFNHCRITRGLSMDPYNILCIAKDILLHTSYTSAEDYADKEIMSHRVIGLVFCTLLTSVTLDPLASRGSL